MATHRTTLVPGEDAGPGPGPVEPVETKRRALGDAASGVVFGSGGVDDGLGPTRTDPTAVGTAEYDADAVIAKLGG